MESAIFGLVGVLLGALITGGSNYFVAKMGQDAARKARETEIKTAARLVHADLRFTWAAFSIYVEKGRWWPPEGVTLSTNAWESNRHILASALSRNDWHVVMAAVEAVRQLIYARSNAAEMGALDKEVASGVLDRLNRYLEDVSAGEAALDALVKD